MSKQKLKGLWIPAEVLLNENLSDKEKIILSMILYLSDGTGSCFASNKYIASIVNITSDRVSKIVSSLKDKGYVDVNLKYKIDTKEIEERQIIKPKDNVIQNLYQDNMNLHMQLSRQAQVIEEAEKYQKERDKIMADNAKLHCEVDNIKTEYNKKEFDMEWKYTNKINKLEKENNLIRDFERENNIMLDAEKQIKHEEREKDLEMER